MRDRMFIIMLFSLWAAQVLALTVEGANRVHLGGISFDLNLYADTRQEVLNFDISSSTEGENTTIHYSSPKLDVDVCLSPRDQYDAESWLVSVEATYKWNLYLHDVYLSMDPVDAPIIAELKGIEAIHTGDCIDNQSISPYRDKAVEYAHPNGRFWIVASGYDECDGVEGLSDNQIVLYDHKGHFFRRYVPGKSWELMMDTLYKPAGSTHSWSFLLFGEKPALLEINRWPGNNRAALCITNDADGESLDRLKTVFEGSNNPANPKYYNKGFFARNIPVSNTVFGCNQTDLGEIWQTIKNHGNTIGYHTFASDADPLGSNQQALLTDLVPYNIRLWVDHAVSINPEDVSFQGINTEHESYIADVINASEIDYIWPSDTPYTNPFDAYEEIWRLPHLVYEAQFTRPIWFFGRTRMEYWDYTHYLESLSMKYLMTPENLDKLLEDRGLHISYTHLSWYSSQYVRNFWEIADNGDFEIRDEVDDMLLMLDFYRTHRNLWIDTLENIFDRMLAIEKLQITSCQRIADDVYQITLKNASELDLRDVSFRYLDTPHAVPLLAKGDSYTFYAVDNPQQNLVAPNNYLLRYDAGTISLKSRYDLPLAPMKIEIFNIRGQQVISYRTETVLDQWVQPFDHFASGVYFARFSTDNGVTMSHKFIVVK